MSVSGFEVALFALIGLVLLVPVLRDAVWKASRTEASNGEGARSASGSDELRWRWAGWVGGTLFAIAIINGLAYSVHTSQLGGSADIGKRAEGRYFVSAHGKYTEVTKEQWWAVLAHGLAKDVTSVFGLAVGAALLAYSQRTRGSTTAESGSAPDRPGVNNFRDV